MEELSGLPWYSKVFWITAAILYGLLKLSIRMFLWLLRVVMFTVRIVWWLAVRILLIVWVIFLSYNIGYQLTNRDSDYII
ncbi:hypothetical protein [Sulfobacillus thermosulfidooxidans]|uniref:hypothetical protein n=1 Tax=Sulfobacillus thermosulfidooxidans TaxID=28034 RepID=UPI000490C937|nr:hypothetical protein [Sulfobacillus thermosulfidooxidans]OLZ11061.1 hypothetical protein BFX05_08510 [Sulfobacillus thermosulfidooxidans]OLZ13480.1 hypothetical protein BFX06_09940 [Sulfobacillus thermosulfidooxidans]OLZ20745.1 hypothetical protein BFX07_14365 [Sulfobacillus thermosulfidooxidans]